MKTWMVIGILTACGTSFSCDRQVPAAGPATSTAEVNHVASFNDFAERFRAAAESKWAGTNHKERTVSILSADVRRTDSFSSPMIGELVISDIWSTNISGHPIYTQRRYTLEFTPENSGWKPRKARMVLEKEIGTDKSADVGQEQHYPASWIQEIIDLIPQPSIERE